ncbi:MAG: DUF3784 domain-containing protein [Candidatus Azobacteroides sp.]|nr:DUF3784 domain-containing protein [Candidatus Azobacteroides sp.]
MMILILLLGISLLFITIGCIINVSNAPYLLHHYQKLKEEEKKQFDLQAYTRSFRKYHLFLGITLLFITMALVYLFGLNAVLLLFVLYPALAYSSSIWSNTKYLKIFNKRWDRILIISMLPILAVFILGLQENKLNLHPDKIKVEGYHGEEIAPSEIRSVELVHQLPEIRYKKNGFGMKRVRKGYFKTGDSETVKLILNTDKKPYLLFTKKNGERIYFSANEKSSAELYRELKEKMPGLQYK